jgi:hypothetical protein
MTATVTRLPSAQRNELMFRLDSETIEADTVQFLHREIRFLHDHLGMTYTEMGRITGVSPGTIARYYHGKTKHPYLGVTARLLAHLNLEFDPVTMALRRRHENGGEAA